MKLYNGDAGETLVYFDDYLKLMGYTSWEYQYTELCEAGLTEDEIRDFKQQLLDNFYDFCDDNEYEGQEI